MRRFFVRRELYQRANRKSTKEIVLLAQQSKVKITPLNETPPKEQHDQLINTTLEKNSKEFDNGLQKGRLIILFVQRRQNSLSGTCIVKYNTCKISSACSVKRMKKQGNPKRPCE